MNCYNDWADDFMDRAIDQVSGRLTQPITLTEENAWRKKTTWNNWNNGSSSFIDHWHNMISDRRN